MVVDIFTEDIDSTLESYIALKKQLKEITKRIFEINKWCKQQGPFSTDMFVCSVECRSQLRMRSIEECSEIMGGLHELKDLGFIQIIEFDVVSISKKADTL